MGTPTQFDFENKIRLESLKIVNITSQYQMSPKNTSKFDFKHKIKLAFSYASSSNTLVSESVGHFFKLA